jgi:hypothetical protein
VGVAINTPYKKLYSPNEKIVSTSLAMAITWRHSAANIYSQKVHICGNFYANMHFFGFSFGIFIRNE